MLHWDESRYGASSFEMLHGNTPFVVTYNYIADQESTKPVLMHWLQAASILLFGFNEMAVRLPSALAGLFICFALVFFTKRNFNSFSLGAIASFILLTAEGFIGIDHSVRTADYDALLTLFSFLGALSFFTYNQDTTKYKYLFYTFLFFAFAIITKGAAGLFYLPGLFVYAIIKKNIFKILKTKWLYISFSIFLIIVIFIFGMREYYSPGYLSALNKMEILGRHGIVQDAHKGDWSYYLHWFSHYDFTYWCFIIPAGWILGLLSKNKLIRDFSLFSIIITISFYLILTSSQTKLRWYELPLLPLLALQAAIFIWVVCKYASGYICDKFKISCAAIYSLFLLSIFAMPYINSVLNASERKLDEGFINYNNVQSYLKLELDEIKNGKFVVAGYAGHFLFYYYKLNDKAFNMKIQFGHGNYSNGEKLIVDYPDYQKEIETKYNVTIIREHRGLKVYQILCKKQ